MLHIYQGYISSHSENTSTKYFIFSKLLSTVISSYNLYVYIISYILCDSIFICNIESKIWLGLLIGVSYRCMVKQGITCVGAKSYMVLVSLTLSL